MLHVLFLSSSLALGQNHKGENFENEASLPPGTAFLNVTATGNKIELDFHGMATSLFSFSLAPSGETEERELAIAKQKWKAQSELFTIEGDANCSLKPELTDIILAQPKDSNVQPYSRLEAVATYECKKLGPDHELNITLFGSFPKLKELITTVKNLSNKTIVLNLTRPTVLPL